MDDGDVPEQEEPPRDATRDGQVGEIPRSAEAEPIGGLTSAASSAAGSAHGARALWRTQRADEVLATLKRIGMQPPGGWTNEHLEAVAKGTLEHAGTNGKCGALGRFLGHHFEALDARTYTLRGAGDGKSLVLRHKPTNPGYDASRFVNGRFAGGVQHKLGTQGLRQAAEKLEAAKPGSAGRATFRVPADQLDNAKKAVAGRARVQASDLTTDAVRQRSQAGLNELAKGGAARASALRQAGRAAGSASVSGAVIGGVLDAGKLRRGDISLREFGASRVADAAEGAACAAAATGVGVAVSAAATSIATAGGVAAGVAGVAAASTVVIPVLGALAAGVVVTRAAAPLRRGLVNWASKTDSNQEHHGDDVAEAPDPFALTPNDDDAPATASGEATAA